jgi:hypothetical protein
METGVRGARSSRPVDAHPVEVSALLASAAPF